MISLFSDQELVESRKASRGDEKSFSTSPLAIDNNHSNALGLMVQWMQMRPIFGQQCLQTMIRLNW
jgi:hypothetical protein